MDKYSMLLYLTRKERTWKPQFRYNVDTWYRHYMRIYTRRCAPVMCLRRIRTYQGIIKTREYIMKELGE